MVLGLTDAWGLTDTSIPCDDEQLGALIGDAVGSTTTSVMHNIQCVDLEYKNNYISQHDILQKSAICIGSVWILESDVVMTWPYLRHLINYYNNVGFILPSFNISIAS